MVVDTHLYDILGVQPDVSERDLKKAFMKKARDTHPDKHKDDPEATEKFQQVNEAYEILKDPQKRQLYDEYGAEGLRDGAGMQGGFDDILSHLFGFPTGGGGPQRGRTRDKIRVIDCTLEELFNGGEKKVNYFRHVACKVCNGNGTADGKPPKVCERCDGHGKLYVKQSHESTFFQSIAPCPECKGTGEIVDEENVCKECKGEKFVEEEKEVECHIERGAGNNDTIVFKGASDEIPNADTGDLILMIQEQEHENFQRNNTALLYHKKISLSEALFGARYPIKHLDGRTLIIETNPKEIIQPGAVQVIENEGMPIKGDVFKKGKLFIQYDVVLPPRSSLTKEFRHALCKVVPHRDEAKGIDVNSEDVHQVTPIDGDISEFEKAKKAKGEKRNEAYRSDDDNYYGYDEEEEGGEQVGCQPM
ncbi:DnaJ subfamily A member 2 [Tritrichomonas foetus]|uniref:DnaJ subfamily A member 2 n=1 Tax=Tritrichomonas foetus TaxID=1144522 RepID=A0A1J4KMS5_9EUKA|nr:dnaJ subfamily A member 2 [Tritrichomonas foetus]OHT12623.1 DnaJ subfamily A member 2 [Tritrichomonas foetus]|eukprot:OHT12623.1 DnaJ subfamily A member 2 [Tritrichomonas foetus]